MQKSNKNKVGLKELLISVSTNSLQIFFFIQKQFSSIQDQNSQSNDFTS